jgi:GT2 family glycosyltransferase
MVIPARYQLKDETWTRGYGPIHYLYLTYPWDKAMAADGGLHGTKWLGPTGLQGRYFHMEKKKADILIDDIMAFQGSLWFMNRDRFIKLGGIDRRYFLWQESTVIGMKVWLSKGRVVRNKNTWYAHLHKGHKYGRGFWLSKQKCRRDNWYAADYWMNDKWPERKRNMSRGLG